VRTDLGILPGVSSRRLKNVDWIVRRIRVGRLGSFGTKFLYTEYGRERCCQHRPVSWVYFFRFTRIVISTDPKGSITTRIRMVIRTTSCSKEESKGRERDSRLFP